MKNLVSKPVTKRYPTVPQTYTELSRGHIENNMDTCILCGICAVSCPATAITVVKAERTWTIDPFSCVQCQNCVRVCPPKSLTMRPEYHAVAGTMSSTTFTKPEEE